MTASASEGEAHFPRSIARNSALPGAQSLAKSSADAAVAVAAAYEARAAEYIAIAGTVEQMDPRDRARIEDWRDSTGGALLDAGCGPGHWTEVLSRGGRAAGGIDLSEAFIASAQSRHPDLQFEVASFRALPFEDGSFGGILAWYSLIHTPPADLPAVFAEFARVLRPGGGLLLGFFDGVPREPFAHAHAVAPAWYWSPEVLIELLADAGFAADGIRRRGREPGEISVRPHADIEAIRV